MLRVTTSFVATALVFVAATPYGAIAAISATAPTAARVAEPPTSSTRPGFGISPSYQTAALGPDQPSLQYDLQLTNTTTRDQQFNLSAVDFGSLDESGGVAFLGSPATEGEHRYGLASWMGLGASTVLVRAGGSAQVTVTIQNRASLAPGGHYGAVLATAIADPGAPAAGDPRVNLRQVLSSLILLTKEGGADPSLSLVSQTANRSGLQLPSTVTMRFQNDGNLHVVPRGVITLAAPGGRVVARGVINEGSAVLLPESFRRLDTPLIGLAGAWLPGRYTLSTTYRYDGTDTTQTLTTHLWYAGQLIGWALIVGLIGSFIGLVWLGIWARRKHFKFKPSRLFSRR